MGIGFRKRSCPHGECPASSLATKARRDTACAFLLPAAVWQHAGLLLRLRPAAGHAYVAIALTAPAGHRWSHRARLRAPCGALCSPRDRSTCWLEKDGAYLHGGHRDDLLPSSVRRRLRPIAVVSPYDMSPSRLLLCLSSADRRGAVAARRDRGLPARISAGTGAQARAKHGNRDRPSVIDLSRYGYAARPGGTRRRRSRLDRIPLNASLSTRFAHCAAEPSGDHHSLHWSAVRCRPSLRAFRPRASTWT